MRLVVSTWSLHRAFKQGMSLPEFMEHCAAMDAEGIEIVEIHLPGTDPDTLNRVREQAYELNLPIVCLALVNDLTVAGAQALTAQTAHLAEGMGWANRLGSMIVRVNSGHTREDPEVVPQVVEALRSLAPLSVVLGVAMALENHGGVSSDPASLARIIREVGSPMLGACPDFGNFPTQTRYQALAQVAPLAFHVHAKSYAFDLDGEETTINYKRCLDILKESGYIGALSVEFEGPGDELQETRRTLELLRRHLG